MPGSLRDRLAGAAYRRRRGFPPPPPLTDMTGYEALLDVATAPEQRDVPGDWLEIGVFLGGGTYQLCRALEQIDSARRVIAVDVFAPDEDSTMADDGRTMAEIYDAHLRFVAGRLGTAPDQEAVFRRVTAGCRNLTLVKGDSLTVELPTRAIGFAHIDGNHSAQYVRGDFERAWALLSPGGVIALDDYAHGIPEVTRTIHELIGEHAAEIDRFWTAGPKTGFVRRLPGGAGAD
jgi:predicted O-methyltransferase YrrM